MACSKNDFVMASHFEQHPPSEGDDKDRMTVWMDWS